MDTIATNTRLTAFFPGKPVGHHQKGYSNLDFNEAGDDWVAVASAGPHAKHLTSLQTDNHASTSSLNFLQAQYSSSCPINSVKALKAKKTATAVQCKLKSSSFTM